jgi:pSer/pThr/pTyr-binding forkhead associated (FHA) protein
VFKKLMSKFKSPTKSGGLVNDPTLEGHRYVKIFELVLSNMEEAPAYTLTHQLTIGSEIGNIVIADPSVSPRHATFILQEDVISVIDHSSMAGTFVNGKKITPGKYIILEETDIIAVGDLEVKINVKAEVFPDEGPPDTPIEEYQPAKLAGEDLQLDPIQSPILTSKPQKENSPLGTPENKVMNFKVQATSQSAGVGNASFLSNLKNKTKGKVKFRFRSYHSANILVRLFSIIGDLIVSYTIVEVFLPFEDFKTVVDYLPVAVLDLLSMEMGSLWDILVADIPYLHEVVKESAVFIKDTTLLQPILVTFFLVRIITTIFFGVSISEFMMGIRAVGNGIWNRIGGVLRVCLGIITGPFLIFDLPALFSKRTFKEFMTFTNTDAESKALTIIGLVVYYPVLFVFVLLAPLFQGFEVVQPIQVSTKIEKRIKVVPKEGEVAPVVAMIGDSSRKLEMNLMYPQNETTLIPTLKMIGEKNKTKFFNSITVYLKDIKRPVTLQVLKTFDLKELVEVGIGGNFMLFEKFPELYSFTHTVMDKSFKKPENKESQQKFAKEFLDFTQLSLGLSVDNFIEMAEQQTFLFKTLVDFRSSILNLLGGSKFDQLGLIEVGDCYFLKASYTAVPKPYDLLIPLTKGPGKLLKVSYDKKEKLKEVSNKIYKFVFEKSLWLAPTYMPEEEKLTAFQVFDLFTSLDNKRFSIDPKKAQGLYGFYFELSADILKRNDMNEYHVLKSSVLMLDELFERILKLKSVDPVGNEVNEKLHKNFKDLKTAVEGRNLNFFGLEQII